MCIETTRYTILWVAFLDPSDSYFLFADLVGLYTHWTYMHICTFFVTFFSATIDDRNLIFGIWWVQKRFPRYGVPIWSSWPNIRSLSSIVAEKNVMKNAFLDPSDSYFLFADLVGFYTHWTYMHIFRHIFLSNYGWQRSDIWSQASYRYPHSLDSKQSLTHSLTWLKTINNSLTHLIKNNH
jgi:hypothetical protein